ncbi:hypothetical protein BD289DRAFT_133509 [Coniella lustricola]|uniref:Uncharacterized protein n=1 Tax=Coniella lustricola TaxID=2025994 RepID=A0A2T2ZVS4_9PEZI|nr:hypothetical protein BD289DRAFT_133509 [Coniella lustricola]
MMMSFKSKMTEVSKPEAGALKQIDESLWREAKTTRARQDRTKMQAARTGGRVLLRDWRKGHSLKAAVVWACRCNHEETFITGEQSSGHTKEPIDSCSECLWLRGAVVRRASEVVGTTMAGDWEKLKGLGAKRLQCVVRLCGGLLQLPLASSPLSGPATFIMSEVGQPARPRVLWSAIAGQVGDLCSFPRGVLAGLAGLAGLGTLVHGSCMVRRLGHLLAPLPSSWPLLPVWAAANPLGNGRQDAAAACRVVSITGILDWHTCHKRAAVTNPTHGCCAKDAAWRAEAAAF